MLKVRKEGFDTKILDGQVEIATVCPAAKGQFMLRVHGVYWHPQTQESTIHGGHSCAYFDKLFEALVVAGQTYERHHKEIAT